MSKPSQPRLRRLVVAGASTTSALVVTGVAGPWAGSVEAQIVYNSVSFPVPATTNGLYINVETLANSTNAGSVPGWDINPWSSTALNFFNPPTAGSNMMRYPGVTTGSVVGSLLAGQSVDSSASFTGTGTTSTTFGSNPGEWSLNAPNYFGFRFTASDNQLHYGWGTLLVGAAPTDRTVTELAYESTAGVGILVGATGITAVPEPGPGTLALLATGAAGLIAWRKNRRPARAAG